MKVARSSFSFAAIKNQIGFIQRPAEAGYNLISALSIFVSETVSKDENPTAFLKCIW